MKPIQIFFLLATSAYGVTVGTPTVVSGSLTDTSVQLTYTVSDPSYCWAEYGTSTGVYTKSATGLSIILTSTCYVTLVNLSPATTYYVRVNGRPNANNSTGIGYASEITVTTAAASYADPTLPATMTLPTYPNTTGYPAPVVLTPSGTGNDNCGLQAAISSATYPTIIEIPQGAICNTRNTGIQTGFLLEAKPVAMGYTMNDPDHPWIIIRTARTPALLAPDGTRQSPELSAPLATIYQPTRSIVQGSGFISDSSGIPHHYWIDNVQFGWLDDTVAGSQNPQPYTNLISVSANVTTTDIPHWIVADRLYIVPPAAPFRLSATDAVIMDGENVALINSYIKVGYWREYVNTLPDASYVGNAITQGTGTWQRKTTDSAWTIASTVTATGTLSGGYAGSYAMYLNASGVTLEYTTPGGGQTASWSCPNCFAVTAVTTPAVPATARKIATGTITAGAIASISAYGCGGYTCEGAVAISATNGPGPMRFENNYVSSPQTAFFVDGNSQSETTVCDVYFQRNELTIDPSWLVTHPTSNGWYYTNRNLWEIKKGCRWLINGNKFSHNFGNVTNNGAAVVWSTRALKVGSTDVGIRDQTFTNNTIENSSSAFYIGGLTELGFTDQVLGPVAKRFKIANNILNNIDGLTWTTTTTGVTPFGNLGNLMSTFLGFDQVQLSRNTFRRSLGTYPSMTFYAGPSAKLRLWGNVLSTSSGGSGIVGFNANTTPLLSAFPGDPFVVNDASNLTTTLAGSSGAYSVALNALVGGKIMSGAYPGNIDLTGAQMTTICSTYPGTSNACVAGETQDARETAAGLLADGNLRYDSPYKATAGADIAEVTAAQGTPTSMAVSTTTTTATVTFRAPVAAERCSLAWSTDGATWPVGNLATSTGSDRAQTVTATGLTTKTPYYLRLICATQTQAYLVRTK